MNSQPTVSVVMCTYNGDEFVDEQIDSIIRQDYPITELIIADDCSTDKTWEKIKVWKARFPFINAFQNKENVGYNKNFEQVIKLASSELIAMADQDDIWLPQKISKTVPAFANPEVMLAHCRSVPFENGKLEYRRTRLHYHFEGRDVRRFFFFGHVMGHDAIFRSTLVKQVLPIPTGIIYDWWIAANALANGIIAAVPEFLVYHRIHSNNHFFSTNSPSKKKELDLNETLRILATITTLQPTDKQYIETLISLIEEKMAMPSKSFSKPLFKFLYQHRKVIFGHKRRLFPEFAYLKSVIKYARFDYKGKGMSI